MQHMVCCGVSGSYGEEVLIHTLCDTHKNSLWSAGETGGRGREAAAENTIKIYLHTIISL